MALPGDLTTISVTSAYPAVDGTPLAGTVTFDAGQPIADSTGKVIFSGSVTKSVFNGTMQPVVLPCTDNSTLNPTNFQYAITETLNGNTRPVYYVSLPHSLGATVDLSALSPGSPTAPTVNSGRTVNVYAPGTVTTCVVNTTTLAAFSSGNICTGQFIAPASGKVIIEASFGMTLSTGGNKVAYGLAAVGSVSPVVTSVQTYQMPSGGSLNAVVLRFLVTGLTTGTTYNFDLLGCTTAAGTATITAFSSTALGLGSGGAPVIFSTASV
jgi:hypothetical protein